MEFISSHQLDVMLFLSGCCGILAVMTMMPKFMSRQRRIILTLMEAASTLLLICDRLSYLYRGDASTLGWFTVRISNGACYFFMLFIPFLVTQFMRDLYKNEGGLERAPKRLAVCDVLFAVGVVLLVVSQFTGLYYTFDGQNRYQRSPENYVSYIIPVIIVVMQESVVIQHRARLRKNLSLALGLGIVLPTIAAVVQFFLYGLSLTSITTVVVVIGFYVYVLCSLGEEVENAKNREIESYKAAQKREAVMFTETTEALANAIDAKDKYTHGHSTRVAAISKRIAKEAGFTDAECDQVYFAALLHDVGKIGVRDDVINKHGELTDEEFEEIRQHPVFGERILSSIKESPYLSTGAHYHHERYDGTGYPEGLSGEDIPRIARIISVADAYDAMTSTRSYRAALSKQEVKDELLNGMGTQFDREYAEIMLRLMDEGATEDE